MAYHHGDLATAAIERAYALVLTSPHEAISIRELADALDVTPRAIYRHHGDRMGILQAVAAMAFDELCQRIEGKLDRYKGDARTALMEAYVRFALESATRYRLMFGLGHGRLREHEALWATVHRLIVLAEQAVDSSPLVLEGHAKRDHIVAIWSMAHGLITLYFGGTIRAASHRQAHTYIMRQLDALIEQP